MLLIVETICAPSTVSVCVVAMSVGDVVGGDDQHGVRGHGLEVADAIGRHRVGQLVAGPQVERVERKTVDIGVPGGGGRRLQVKGSDSEAIAPVRGGDRGFIGITYPTHALGLLSVDGHGRASGADGQGRCRAIARHQSFGGKGGRRGVASWAARRARWTGDASSVLAVQFGSFIRAKCSQPRAVAVMEVSNRPVPFGLRRLR